MAMPIIEKLSPVPIYKPRTCCQVIILYSSGGASAYLPGMYYVPTVFTHIEGGVLFLSKGF